MTIVIVFKNGYELKTKCTNADITKNSLTGQVTNIKYSGVTENKPLNVDFDEVICIYRIVSDEVINNDGATQ